MRLSAVVVIYTLAASIRERRINWAGVKPTVPSETFDTERPICSGHAVPLVVQQGDISPSNSGCRTRRIADRATRHTYRGTQSDRQDRNCAAAPLHNGLLRNHQRRSLVRREHQTGEIHDPALPATLDQLWVIEEVTASSQPAKAPIAAPTGSPSSPPRSSQPDQLCTLAKRDYHTQSRNYAGLHAP